LELLLSLFALLAGITGAISGDRAAGVRQVEQAAAIMRAEAAKPAEAAHAAVIARSPALPGLAEFRVARALPEIVVPLKGIRVASERRRE